MGMNLNIPVSNFEYIDDNDDHFLKVRLQAIASGENLNHSDFNEAGMESSKDSFRGKPILCAFPENKYTGEYKIGDGHNSSDIMYDSEYDEFYHSYLDPNSERMVGYISPDSEINIETIDGKQWICMDAVILRRYNYELVKDILNKKYGKSKRTNKRISVEIEVLESHFVKNETQDYEIEVIDKFKGMGVTILFDNTQEAIVGANLKAFCESEKYTKFKSFVQHTFDAREYIDSDKIGSGSKITIKRDKVSNTPWGDVDKSELYKKALKASNYKAVVRFIYAKVEPGWEENPSEKLKYPIGQISGGEAFYNKGGLSSALGYSKTEGDTEVTEKINKIRNKLNLDESTDEYAVEKNKDILDDKDIISKYPDSLEMSASEEKNFQLTNNQKMEILNTALCDAIHENEDEDSDEDHDYWYICDMDDIYLYVKYYEDGSPRTYRIEYILNEDEKTAEVYIDTREEVICGGYEVIKEKEDDSVEEKYTPDGVSDKETMAKETDDEETMAKETDDEETMAKNVGKKDLKDRPEDKKEAEKSYEELDLKAEDSEEMAKECGNMGATFICKASNYVIYSENGKVVASPSDDLSKKFEVSVNMTFDVKTENIGGVPDSSVEPLAPIKVSFESKLASTYKKMDDSEVKFAELSTEVNTLQEKLNTYKCKELSNKFDEISFDSNITVSEKTEWKNRINKNEFSNEDDLVEKFGGFVFKKNMENKYNAYTSETIAEKASNKKAYEELIDQYMTDK